MLDIFEHLADADAYVVAAAATTEAASTNQEDTAAPEFLRHGIDRDPSHMKNLQLLAEKKVREAEEKAKLDEESDWWSANGVAASVSSDAEDSALPFEERAAAARATFSPTTRTDDDILQSIEESVELNNQVCGFVSTFDFPLSPIAPVSNDGGDEDESGNDEVSEADYFGDDIDDDEGGCNLRHVTESLSSSVDDDGDDSIINADDEKGGTEKTSPIASIFRVASNNSSSSSSPSTSNKDVSSPSSLASDSTEFTNNVSSHSIVITPYKQPQQRHLQKHIDITQEEADGIVSPFPSPTATTPTAAAGLVVSTRKKQMSNYNDNNDYNNSKDAGKMTGKESQSKQQQKKQSTTSKRVKINNEQSSNQTTTWTKRKNNLVFSHMPITKQQQQQQQQSLSLRKQQHQQQLSQPQHSNNYNASKLPPILLSPNKPPTHPSSSTIKPSSQIFQTHSYMSDADMSTDLSEATPITTPAKSSWFRNYSDEDENDDDDDDQGEDGERKEGNYWVGGSANMDNEEEKDNDDSSSTKEDNVDGAINHIGKTSQSSNDLVGLEIFDTSETTLDNNNQPSLNWDISASIADLSFVSKRQYSNENSFFHGIYESGLDSASFEQVDTSAEERMCMDAEIELVYNVSGVDLPSFFMDRSSGDNSTDNSSVGNASVVGDDLDECASVEERRKVVRRIQQWRRGRARESRESRGPC